MAIPVKPLAHSRSILLSFLFTRPELGRQPQSLPYLEGSARGLNLVGMVVGLSPSAPIPGNIPKGMFLFLMRRP